MNALEQAKSALKESKRLIEYLHGNAQATGTGNTVLAQIDTALFALSSAETAEPKRLSASAVDLVARMLWEKQFEGTPWAGKRHLIRPDSLGDYRSLAEKIMRALTAPHDAQERDRMVLMLMIPSSAMCEVMEEEGWLWEDLLVAAEAITDEQYAAISAPQQAAQPAPAGGMTDELPPLPCAELSMPLHGLPSVHLYTADQIRERDVMWQTKINALLSRSNAPHPPQLNSLGLAVNWSVTVEVDAERVLCISDQHYAGMPDLDPYKETIRSCAKHLLAFIGEPNAPQPEAAQPAPMPLAWTDEMFNAAHEAMKIVSPHVTLDTIVRVVTTGLSAALPLPAQQVQNKQEVHDALQKAFMTLQSSGGEDRSIVLKFNRKKNAYIVHDFLLHCAVKDDPSNAGAQQVAEQKDAKWIDSEHSMTLTAKQVMEALEFIAPDRDTDIDQLECEVTLINLTAEHAPLDDDNKRMPAGLYMYVTEYPEEGCVPLFDVDAAMTAGGQEK
jgi:hypothetical protein